MSDETLPGKKLDDRYDTLLAKITETSQDRERDHREMLALRRDVDMLKKHLLPKVDP